MSLLDLHRMSGSVLFWVIQSLVYGTLLALITWILLRLLNRRIPAALQGLFWLVVLVKFVIPVGPALPFSLASWTSGLSNWLPDHSSSRVAGVPALQESADEESIVFVLHAGPATDLPAHIEATSGSWPIATVLGIAYLVCVISIGIWRLNAYRRFAASCRRLSEADIQTRELVVQACAQLGVRRVPDVRLSDQAPAPFILGGFRPCLVLSRRQLESSGELEAVVLHEIAHLRRGDFFVRYLQWFAGTLLFFWPVVAWVNRRIDLAREHACDDWALRHGRLSAGDYARCLLRALHPVERRPIGFAPAAMAKNLISVERRIEMILENSTRRTFGSLGLPAMLLLAGWSVFTLSGAAANVCPPESESKKSDGRSTKQTEEGIWVVGDCDDAIELDLQAEPIQGGQVKLILNGTPMVVPLDGDAAQGEWVFTKHLGDEACLGLPGFVTEKQLEEFAAAHPTADADANGKVSRNERNAYLAVLALSSPTAVLGQFPTADKNSDGMLDTHEAALLVSGGMMDFEVHGAPHAVAFAGAQVAQVAPQELRFVRVQGEVHAEGAAQPEPADNLHARVATAFKAAAAGPSPSDWLLQNVAVTPTVADVAKVVPAIEEAPMASFLKLHPEADLNQDGKLSREEREAHMEKQMSDVRARMLRRHPQADTDGDGVLSREEEHAYFAKRARQFVDIEKADGAAGVRRRVMLRKTDGATAEGEQVIEIQAEVGEEPKDVIIVKPTEKSPG
jgi:beta-lactamase regulating signal transducer with metallopeptidase domain